ncbi:ATPase, T2SS/T4P/T4SS family [Acinetobacter variabilis]|uniref:ATPase, T2SS/T4P/T4SS family n=1 Tax=Acinetobacter variabilis TaxID=70346 RepID=UPI0028B1AA20|nr:ATPase, T2SS/T4P/T4SS family [Acinetobacter variabilis]
MKLNELVFRDLLIGSDYTEFREMIGASSKLASAPDALKADIENLKQYIDTQANSGRSEFSVVYDSRLYRVTVAARLGADIEKKAYVIRQTPSETYPIEKLGISQSLIDIIRDSTSSGLVLIAGGLGHGKTSTAASILYERNQSTGSVSVAIEDPIETQLDGRHGDGRCIQIEVNENEGYAAALKKTLRMGASNMLIGEIRDGDTAHEALKASLNGMFVITTIHAKSPIDAIERMIVLCNERSSEAQRILSKSLLIVMHQTLESVTDTSGVIKKKTPNIQGYAIAQKYNLINGQVMEAKIARGDIASLKTEFDSYKKAIMNNTRG